MNLAFGFGTPETESKKIYKLLLMFSVALLICTTLLVYFTGSVFVNLLTGDSKIKAEFSSQLLLFCILMPLNALTMAIAGILDASEINKFRIGVNLI